MSSRPLVSVIIPFLNAEKFIEEAIASVFAQTYENWELLLVDNASTDGSTEIARRYIQQFPEKVRYLQHSDCRDHGVAASRNLGIAHARGEYLAFLDADDVWLPAKLERQVTIMEHHSEFGLIFNSILFWYEDGTKNPCPTTLSPGRHPVGAWTLKMLESDNNGACPSSMLVRKSFVIGIGAFEESFRGTFQLFEDQLLCHKVSLNAPIYYDPEPMVHYRKHETSFWGKSSYYEQRFARMHLYAWLIRYLKEFKHGHFQSEENRITVRFYSILMRYLIEVEQIGAAAALSHSVEQYLPKPPHDGEWNYLSAFCLHNLQDNLKEALSRYDLALENGFDEFWVRYNRGSLHAHLGNLKEAREDLERAVELNPGHEGARQVLAQLSSKGERERQGNFLRHRA